MSTSTTVDAPKPSNAPQVASPREVSRWLSDGSAVLVDVREPDEHARERIPGSRLNPLSRFDAAEAAILAARGATLVFHCRSGKRSAEACRLLAAVLPPGTPLLSLAGGIEAWKTEGLPTNAAGGGPAISVLRQTQLVIGLGVLSSVLLGWLIHPVFLGLGAFLGAGLTFAGATGTCGLATVMSKLPWNRVNAPVAPEAAKIAGCTDGACSCSRK